MRKIVILGLLITGCLTVSKAQEVESGAFNALLKSMLKKSVPTVSVEALASQNTGSIIFLDAREREEYDVSHLKNAKWVGYEDFEISRLKGVKKDQEIIIYCSIGVRSEKIGEQLLAEGYKNVKNLYGSIFEWVNQGNPVYDSAGLETAKVHAYSRTWGIWLKAGEKIY